MSISAWLRRSAPALHAAIYRRTNGRIMGRFGRVPNLLLTTTGRRSGQPHTTPLAYFPAGRMRVLVAANGGRPSPPNWYRNLQAIPNAEIQIGSRIERVTAHTATEAEHKRLWPQITAAAPAYARMARRTGRSFPVVILRPRG